MLNPLSFQTVCFLCFFVVRIGFSEPISEPPQGSLKALGGFYGFPQIQESNTHISFRSQFSTLSFVKGSRKSTINGVLLFMNGATSKKGAGWSLTPQDVTHSLDPLLRSSVTLTNAGHSIVVIDPGHGGTDAGTVGRRRVEEKRVVMDISKRVTAKLRAAGITVRLTRETDVAVPLAERAKKAKRWKADLFVSIHVNSSSNRGAKGHETFVMPGAGFPSTGATKAVKPVRYPGNAFDSENMLLGYYIQKGLLAYAKGADRGVKRARYLVLKNAPCPAALVECGFVSNTGEEALMIDARYREKLADGIARGIMTYVSRVRSAKGQ